MDPGVTIAGDGNESIYTVTTGVAKLYLSKAVASGTKRTLHVHLFDIGDAETTGTLSIRDDAGKCASGTSCAEGSSTWLTDADCQWYYATSKTDTSPLGGMLPQPNCHTAVSSANNNAWLDFLITIPANYQCTPGIGVDSCWLKAYITWDVPTKTVHDVTSWYAWIEGDPVRLVAPGGT